jgi:hypothetical protein
MDVLAAPVDVSDHLVDGAVAVLRDPRLVSARRVKLVDRSGELERRFIWTLLEALEASGISLWSREMGIDVAPVLTPNATDPGFAEDEIGKDSGERQREDDDDPREAGSRFAVRSKENAHENCNLGQNECALGRERQFRKQL